nr:outer membrane beta-barrel protein [Pedobacter panaciterrae]
MKTTFISLLALLLCLTATAQSNFYKLSLGGGAGLTQSFTDYEKHKFGKTIYGVGEFFFTPFISLGGEGQIGRIKGEDNDLSKKSFLNSYKSLTINGKLYMGAIIDYKRNAFSNTIKGLYLGAGLGGILNNVSGAKPPKTKDIIVPVNLGYTYYFPDRSGYYRYGINVNYQSTVSLDGGIDGLETSHTDLYTYFSLGIRYQFGPMGLSRKTLY